MSSWQVYRDGEPQGPPLDTHNAAFMYVLDHQGQSFDYATRYGGWEVRPADPAQAVVDCADQLASCKCELDLADGHTVHVCVCGGSWDDDGTVVALPRPVVDK